MPTSKSTSRTSFSLAGFQVTLIGRFWVTAGGNLYRLGVPDKVIQAILRHSNVNVTLGYYIKPQTPDVVAAMGKFEAEIAAHNFRDSNGTVNPYLGCNAQICKLGSL
jgi:hypothetical protein